MNMLTSEVSLQGFLSALACVFAGITIVMLGSIAATSGHPVQQEILLDLVQKVFSAGLLIS